MKIDAKCFNVQDFASLDSNKEKVTSFHWEIRLSNIGHQNDVIFELRYEGEMANITIFDGSPTPYFYLHLHDIHDLGVLIPFTPFEVEFLVIENGVTSQLMPTS